MMRSLFGVLILASVGCNTLQVSSDYDPTVNFSGYRTFGWMALPHKAVGDPRVDNALIESHIRSAVERDMQARGYSTPQSGEPDFFVAPHTAINEKLMIQQVPAGAYGPGWYRPAGSVPVVHEYTEGSLVLDVIDAKTRQLIWRGWAMAEVDFTRSAEERQRKIDEAVHKILDQFPPKPARPAS